ncbi:autotransporter domain-containing protein [Ancylobacter sp.]|uniref:autotransporter domain-containing protein n=1 Tax=Ancylobacter sp. TaxID=1872567 RepID=UPI003D13054F
MRVNKRSAVSGDSRHIAAAAAGVRGRTSGASKRTALLAGTALITGIVVATLPSLVRAEPMPGGTCIVTNPGSTDLTYRNVVCTGDITGKDEAKYKSGAEPVSPDSKTFDMDLVLTAPETVSDSTVYNYFHDGEGIVIESDKTAGKATAGYDVTVSVGGTSAISSSKNGISVTTKTADVDNTGAITITSGAFIEALGKDGNGIKAESEGGNISITNTGIIGVTFDEALTLSENQFYVGETPATLKDGSAFDISQVAGSGIVATTKTGTISIYNGVAEDGLVIESGAIYAAKDGISATTKGTGASGEVISIVNVGDIYAGESGIVAEITDKTSTGGISIINAGHIESKIGISVKNEGTGRIDVYNLSDETIISSDDGIHVDGKGGNITVANGLPVSDGEVNLDGVIVAGKIGINVTNKGGNVLIFNNDFSEIYAGGDYGISAKVDNKDATEDYGNITIVNSGFVGAEGANAKAGIYAEITKDSPGGYVAVSNGFFVSASADARVNAYKDNGDGTFVVPSGKDAGTGIQIKMEGGSAGEGIVYDIAPEFGGFAVDEREFGTIVFNSGSWDFSGADDYLTPGYADGLAVAEGTEAQTTGGVFAPGGSAVDIKYKGDDAVGIINYGTLIGAGGKDTPVIKIDADKNDGGVFVYNGAGGIVGSTNTPFDWGDGLFNAVSDSRWGSVVNRASSGGLSAFADASDDLAVKIKGGASFVVNDGLIIGRLDIDGKEGGSEGEGNSIFVNNGAWFTTGESAITGRDGEQFSEAVFINNGLIQTGFDSSVSETASFKHFTLYNDGLVSMIDGGAGDRIEMLHDYVGVGGRLGVDVNYREHNADMLVMLDHGDKEDHQIFPTISGSTGIVINKVGGSSGIDPTGIVVVDYSGSSAEVPVEKECTGGSQSLCRTGDAFFISSTSQGYINIGGYGAVQDGFRASFLRQDKVDEHFELYSDWGVDARVLPSLVTAAQSIWYQSNTVVQDHIYDGYFSASADSAASVPLGYAATNPGPTKAPFPVKATPQVEDNGRILVWARAGGAWGSNDGSSTSLIGGTPITIDTGYDQDTYSFFGGADYLANSNWRIGVFGGYETSDVKYNAYGLSADFDGGSIGGFVAYKTGPFYADAEVKADFLTLDYNSAVVQNPSVDVTNVGLRLNAGYRFGTNLFYVEPVVSFSYLSTSFDDGVFAGTSVNFKDGESTRGGVGARIGTSFATSTGSADLYVLAKYWNEFGDNNSASFFDPVTLDSAAFFDALDGSFGEVTGTAAFYSLDRTTAFIVSGGSEFNSDSTQITGKIGLEKKF